MPKNDFENEAIVNKQKLIEEWESAIEAAEFYGKGKEERLISYMKDFVSDLNQLDEPEVLSQEWIDKNKTSIDRKLDGTPIYKVREELLQNLLVPEQELPVIPKFVADYLDFAKSDVPLMRVMELANTRNELPKWKKEYDWISANDEKFARAWLDGYTVEEEQKYRVMSKNVTLLGRINGMMLTTAEILEYYPEYKPTFELTEQEIKDYDERYWPFAVKVEELEE